MTDNEIIKALESCTSETQCLNCPRFRGSLGMSFFTKCDSKLKSDVLDLINRQKAEIERLKTNLNIDLENFATEYDNKIKAEAVKEFAERLKESKKKYEGTLAGFTFTMTELDNLVKEMVKRILEIDGSVPNVATVADFVEVVRCKNCKHSPNIGTLTKGMRWCRRFRNEIHPNDFCSYGQRRTENDLP